MYVFRYIIQMYRVVVQKFVQSFKRATKKKSVQKIVQLCAKNYTILDVLRGTCGTWRACFFCRDLHKPLHVNYLHNSNDINTLRLPSLYTLYINGYRHALKPLHINISKSVKKLSTFY